MATKRTIHAVNFNKSESVRKFLKYLLDEDARVIAYTSEESSTNTFAIMTKTKTKKEK